MNKTHGKPYGPYEGLYHDFYEASPNARGYNFGQGPRKKIAPPTPKGLDPPAWWSLDRPKRLGIIRRIRDQYLNEILDLRKNGEGHFHCSKHIYRLSVSNRGKTGTGATQRRV